MASQGLPKLSLADYPMLNDSGQRSAEEVDLLQRSKKKIKAGSADAQQEEMSKRSFSDMLKGAVRTDTRSSEMEEDDLDFGPMKSHITILKHQRGRFTVPEFVFSNAALQKIRKPYKLSLIVKLLGKKLGLSRIEQRIQKMWAKAGVVSIVDLSNDFFIVNFTSIDDYEMALLGGPWMISDCYLTVREWRPNFDPKVEAIEDVLIWIRFPDLPLEYYDEGVLEAMGNEIGKTIKVDMSTSMQSRGGYARVGVQVDLRKALLSLYIIDKKERPIVYEGLHLLCFCCGMYGHTEKECKHKEPMKRGEDKGVHEVNEGKEEYVFGEWSKVQNGRGYRRFNQNFQRNGTAQGAVQRAMGSRFANLDNLEDDVDGRNKEKDAMRTDEERPQEKVWLKRKQMVKSTTLEKDPTMSQALVPVSKEVIREQNEAPKSQGSRRLNKGVTMEVQQNKAISVNNDRGQLRDLDVDIVYETPEIAKELLNFKVGGVGRPPDIGDLEGKEGSSNEGVMDEDKQRSDAVMSID